MTAVNDQGPVSTFGSGLGVSRLSPLVVMVVDSTVRSLSTCRSGGRFVVARWCGVEGGQEVGEAGWVGQVYGWEVGGVEPAEGVVFLGGGVGGFALPVGDQEGVDLEGGIGGCQGEGLGIVDVDA
jgi:hypothetical protein